MDLGNGNHACQRPKVQYVLECKPEHVVLALKEQLMESLNRMTLILALLAGASSAFAGGQTPRADVRQDNQEARIEQGVATGELTNREADRLDARQDHIANVEARAKADGVVTRKERVKLEVKQDRSSRAIAKQKHDRQMRRR